MLSGGLGLDCSSRCFFSTAYRTLVYSGGALMHRCHCDWLSDPPLRHVYHDWFVTPLDHLLIPDHFFTTLAVGIVHTTSRSFLIATTPPEKQWLVHSVASTGMTLFTVIHMFVVQGAVLDTIGFARPSHNCETAFRVILPAASAGRR
jgi:hypothetical protein